VTKVDAIGTLQRAQETFAAAAAARRQAIVGALRAGVPLRELSALTDLSHESIRRVGGIAFNLRGQTLPVTERQADVLIYKLTGFDAGRFPGDVVLLGAGRDWLSATGELARAIERGRDGPAQDTIELGGDRAFAMYQVLRLSYMDRPSDVSRLFDALCEMYQ
jgi:hypothetical protein